VSFAGGQSTYDDQQRVIVVNNRPFVDQQRPIVGRQKAIADPQKTGVGHKEERLARFFANADKQPRVVLKH
jgi:hypothetical protein